MCGSDKKWVMVMAVFGGKKAVWTPTKKEGRRQDGDGGTQRDGDHRQHDEP
jgi:hypothetical protein